MPTRSSKGGKTRRLAKDGGGSRNPNQLRAEIRQGLLLKRECERRVFAAIEEMADRPAVDKEQLEAIVISKTINTHFQMDGIIKSLIKNLSTSKVERLSPQHYEALVEERRINERCGWPLCSRQLGQGPRQQYSICMRTKQVHDLTERKNFCSSECYAASEELKDRLDPSPLWMRPKLRDEVLATQMERKLVIKEKTTDMEDLD